MSMQLEPGARLGPYEIVAPAGAGGMGEVYRARDTRLDRDVAIKILPAEFAQNAQLKVRFEREAKAISQLTHPHICTLYDVGRKDGAEYLVMEYLDGETLAGRLRKGPLPIAEVLLYGSQIAEALDTAHRRGIIHRDVKPANVMLTRSGVKVLDFGLARYATKPAQSDDVTRATEQKPLTQHGMIIGTVQYMAPEQLESRDADARTDIFAIGAVLYEMTTGRGPFGGTSRASLIAAIMQDDPPPITAQQPLTPPALEHVVRKCLEKNPDNRWQSAHDVAEELKWIGESGSRKQTTAGAPPSRRKSVLLGTLVAMAVLAAATLAVLAIRQRSMPVSQLESSILPPEGARFSLSNGPMALSRDGSRLAFVGRDNQGRVQIWIRPLASSTAASVRGTDGASSPFWSPDGRYLGFFADNKLKKVLVEGGVPEVLADGGNERGGAWNSEGILLFSSSYASRLMKVSATGGQPEPVTTGDTVTHGRPSFLPDGRRFVFTNIRAQHQPEGIYFGSLDSKETKMVVPGAYSNAVYTSGFLLYARSGGLWAHRLDLRRLKTSGEPIRIADRVAYDGDAAAAFFSASPNGLVVYCAGGSSGLSRLVWVDRHGKELGTIGAPGMYFHPRLSPDQKRLALDRSDPINAKGDIWIFDLNRNVSSRFSYDPANETAPVWSSDGRRIIYAVERVSTVFRLFEKASSGAGHERALPNLTGMFPSDWSRDGKSVAVSLAHRESANLDIGIATADGRVQRWLETPFIEGGATFSRDGRWIAYTSNESGRREVYVRSFPEPGIKVLVSQGGGFAPAWRGDGRELYYVSEDSKMMAVAVLIGEQFEAGPPMVLFDAPPLRRGGGSLRQYDVTADGQRFVLNTPLEDEAALPMTLIQNWMPHR